MTAYFEQDGSRYAFEDSGKGKVLLFLHGFLEQKEMWAAIIPHFKEAYRCISIDLAGHGESDEMDGVASMGRMADLIHDFLDSIRVNNCSVIGHSMGGYIALELQRKHPEKIDAICLYHSKILPDSKKKGDDRLRAIRAVETGKSFFIKASINNLFGEPNRERLSSQIYSAATEAIRMSKSAIQSCLLGMRARRNGEEVYFNNPKNYFIIGSWDQVVAPEEELSVLEKHEAPFYMIENSGHMSYIESPDEALKALRTFCEQL